jgi:hypothetical protein
MYIVSELVLSAYSPRHLKQGMLFVKKNEDSLEVYELDRDIREKDPYILENGHPVELKLFDISLGTELAKNEEIAWVDEGDDSEDMHEITVDDINIILANKHRCFIQIKDKLYEKEHMIIPVYDEEKVIIKLIEEEEEEK